MIQDEKAIEQAAPLEAQEVASDVFSNAGNVALPGSPAFEQYNIGNENNQASGVGAVLPDSFSGVGIGELSADTGINTGYHAEQLNSDGSPLFGGVPQWPGSANDSMAGIAHVPSINPQPTADDRIVPGGDFQFPASPQND